MRLLLINGNTTAAMTERCRATAIAAARPGTEIVAVTASRGPRVIATRTENALATAAMVELLAEHGGDCDAVLVAVSFDTGLDALREAAPCPVVGMTEAAVHAACLLGGRFGFIGPGEHAFGIYRDVLERIGLMSKLAGQSVVEMRPEDYLDPAAIVDTVVATALDLVRHGRAESLVLAGAAFAGLAAEIQARVPVPLVDGIAAGVVLAQALVDLRPMRATVGSHALPPARELVGLPPVLGRLFAGERS
ncbi:hydantoin racemase [Siculibacillus lacustris]|uniref:Hydantoin racemase n=1 Tax=Siculibacillus lacustris TaxID=1549641 RepID=A0A4Q9VTD5_9HYPH|nr:aspartate/glutamate racemase family protein [Siculibacillus lacustris]TBW38966.1 hydantoin racemase [Siculibacillus lacustris]